MGCLLCFYLFALSDYDYITISQKVNRSKRKKSELMQYFCKTSDFSFVYFIQFFADY